MAQNYESCLSIYARNLIFCHILIGFNPITHRFHIQIKMPISYDYFTHKETSQTTKLIEPHKNKNIKLERQSFFFAIVPPKKKLPNWLHE